MPYSHYLHMQVSEGEYKSDSNLTYPQKVRIVYHLSLIDRKILQHVMYANDAA